MPAAGGFGFAWLDRRLVREGRLARLSPEAATLYLFLVTVADPDGVSFYGEARIEEFTGLSRGDLITFIRELIGQDLLAFRHPVFQILSYPEIRDGHRAVDGDPPTVPPREAQAEGHCPPAPGRCQDRPPGAAERETAGPVTPGSAQEPPRPAPRQNPDLLT
jgi:hypothetical protein